LRKTLLKKLIAELEQYWNTVAKFILENIWLFYPMALTISKSYLISFQIFYWKNQKLITLWVS